jgi:glucose-6-phosphate isomerase
MTEEATLNTAFRIAPGRVREEYQQALKRGDEERFIERLFACEAEVFGKTGDALESIKNRLGWLPVVESMNENSQSLRECADSVIKEGFRHLVVLGMGGSSLAPETFARIFHTRGALDSIDIIDSTYPQMIEGLLSRINLEKAFFVVASKSGKTVETLSQARFFLAKAKASQIQKPGNQFVAITDPGSFLEEFAKENNFRKVFLNPADIGGRYSALSNFGMVPAAFTRADVGALLKGAAEGYHQLSECQASLNSAYQLGALWGVCEEAGIDKLTIVTTKTPAPLAPWIEQLVAESTGKEGKGVVPIEGEPITRFSEYAHDRMFLFLTLAGEEDDMLTILREEAIQAGAPVASVQWRNPHEVGFEFLRQEVATATAGFILGINPFDEPNVQESKDNTAEILAELERTGKLPQPQALTLWDGLSVYEIGDIAALKQDELKTPAKAIKRFFTGLRKDSYVALLGYFERTPKTERALANLREIIRSKFGVATLRGYGPRYLHSIGQLYKGGAAEGQFIVFAGPETDELAIPEANFSFNQLIFAQALGDTGSYVKRNLPTLMFKATDAPEVAIDFLAAQIDMAFTETAAHA